MRPVNALVVHCSATGPNQDIGAKEIRQWHVSAPRNWRDIGYHRVIRRDGTLEMGRPDDQAGAHVEGHNADTIAVCMVGGVDAAQRPEANFTTAQYEALGKLLAQWAKLYPQAVVMGHRDFPGVAKACPSFDVKTWWANNKARFTK